MAERLKARWLLETRNPTFANLAEGTPAYSLPWSRAANSKTLSEKSSLQTLLETPPCLHGDKELKAAFPQFMASLVGPFKGRPSMGPSKLASILHAPYHIDYIIPHTTMGSFRDGSFESCVPYLGVRDGRTGVNVGSDFGSRFSLNCLL